ncbi:hypothetical protein AB0N17_37065 [Streptomyces sp. NPDC051133]|uniref:DUF6919 domain-containing protein n=1 Tax=Streptomyces sp. NPDC051133 TaxID=3155521 RepID=UPI003436C0D5
MSRAISLVPSAARHARTAEGTRSTRYLGITGEGQALQARWRDAGRRRHSEVRAWQSARTLEDVAVLTAQWLRGLLLFHPNGHRGGPDPETLPLADVLAAANGVGILTHQSQPGELAAFHGRPWRQRAFVTAFVADPALARALYARAAGAGLVVRVYRPGSRIAENGKRDAVDVTVWGSRVNTGIGDWVSPRAVRRILPGCDRQAVHEVAAAWQVTLIDPEWGRNTVLWPLLSRFTDALRPDAPSCRVNRPVAPQHLSRVKNSPVHF